MIGPEQQGYAMFGGIMYQRGDTRSYFHIILLPYGKYGCQGIRNSVFIAVLHYTVNVGIILYLVIYITEQKHIMKSLNILQSRYG